MATKKTLPFRTVLDAPVKKVTTSGEKLEDVTSMRLDENGQEVFYISGKTNIYEKIQAEAENAKIENVIAKVLQTGDTSLLEARKGEFIDLTEMPANIFEAQLKIKEAEKAFMELPVEVRKEYNNNFNEFLKDASEGKGLRQPEREEPKPEEKGAEE